MLNWLKSLFGPPVDFAALIDKGAAIIDVRTPAEFKGGHASGSINIPLQKIPAEIGKLRAKGQPVIACCASGNRSGQAVSILKNAGIEAYNIGPWRRVPKFRKA